MISQDVSTAAQGNTSRVLIWSGIIVLSIAVGFVNVFVGGDVLHAIGLILVIGVLALSIFRPDISLYLLIVVSLSIEQAQLDYAWTYQIPYYFNLSNAYPGLVNLPITPFEVHLLAIIVGVWIRRSVLGIQGTPVIILGKNAVILYSSSLLFFVLYGMYRGGAFFPALWEIRGVFYLILLMVFVPQVVRTREQVHWMMWAVIAGLTFRTIETTTHFIAASFTYVGSYEGWGNHEDAGFLATFLVFVFTLFILGVEEKKLKAVATILVIPCILSIIGSDRRTAYPVLAAAMLLVPLVMPKDILRKVLRVGWKVGIVFAIYIAVAWDWKGDNLLLRPAHMVRQGLAGDNPNEADERNYRSNLYRDVENYDLYRMVLQQPLLGAGYGMPIDYHLPLPVTWELGFYIPHNQVLGVFAKTGMLGLGAFATFYLAILYELAHGFGNIVKDKFMRALLLLAGAAVVNHLVFSAFDIMLTYYRNNIYLGALLGMAGSIITIEKYERASESVPVAAGSSGEPDSAWPFRKANAGALT